MINSVRNTVLSVLNKNNYGYISPSDFNLYAKQAQIEIFEDYFSMYNKALNKENARLGGTGYGDDRKLAEETIERFMVSQFLSVKSLYTGKYYAPSIIYGGNDFYKISNISVAYSYYNSVNQYGGLALNIAEPDFIFDLAANGIQSGDIVINQNNTVNLLWANINFVDSINNQATVDLPILGPNQIIGFIKSSELRIAEKVTEDKLRILNRSSFTAPSEQYPVYVQNGDEIRIYGYTYPNINSPQIYALCDYFRYPLDPKWTYAQVLSNGEPVFNPSAVDYQDFELPIEDEPRLVVKILQYCGVSIREAEVYQAAKAQELQDKQL